MLARGSFGLMIETILQVVSSGSIPALGSELKHLPLKMLRLPCAEGPSPWSIWPWAVKNTVRLAFRCPGSIRLTGASRLFHALSRSRLSGIGFLAYLSLVLARAD